MSKKLLTIFSLLLIFFAMSCNNNSTDPTVNNNSTDPTVNNNSTDPTAPLKDSQYVGKWYEETSNTFVVEIKQDGSIDAIEDGAVVATVNGTDVVKEGDSTFKATFSANGITVEVTFTFTDDKTGTLKSSGQEASTFNIVKK